MKLLLFDVDMTLINSAGAGSRSMSMAFKEMFGHNNGLQEISFAGRTDPAILREAFKNHGLAWSEEVQGEFKDRYLQHLRHEITVASDRKRVESGVRELLDVLQPRNDVTLALLTGNWKSGAQIKLEYFDLWQRFEFGAFSDDAWIRSDLPAIAAARFKEIKGYALSPASVFVIGDTPRDVACAKPFGACPVAVATGHHTYRELEEANPGYLFENLTDNAAFISMLENHV